MSDFEPSQETSPNTDFESKFKRVETLQEGVRGLERRIFAEIGDELDEIHDKRIATLPEGERETKERELEHVFYVTLGLVEPHEGESREILLEQHPDIASVVNKANRIQTSKGKGRLEVLIEKREELEGIKLEILPELKERVGEEGRDLLSRINYEAILNTTDREAEINSRYFFLTDAPALVRINKFINDDYDQALWDEFAEAHYLLSFIRDYKQSLQDNSHGQALIFSESQPYPTESEMQQINESIAQIPVVYNQVEAHNELERFKEVGQKKQFVRMEGDIANMAYVMIRDGLDDIPDRFNIDNRFRQALARHFEAEKVKLADQINLQAKWDEIISVDKIYQILQGYYGEAIPAEEASEAQKVVDDMAKKFKIFYRRDPYNRLSPEEAKRDQAFVDSLKPFLEENRPMLPADRRILSSKLVALYYLFPGKGIDQIYENYLARIPASETPKDKGEELKVKANLAMEFLHRLDDKNREDKIAFSDDAPTIGLEYEYYDELEEQLIIKNKRKDRLSAAGYWVDYR